MPLIVDARERDLFSDLQGVEYEQRTLSVADFLVVDAEGNVLLAIERKTAADLEASVRDGRLAEQRARMLEAYGERAAYLIEGRVELSDARIAGPLVGLVVRHRVPVFRTSDKRDTVALIAHLVSAAAKGRLDRYTEATPAAAADAPKKKIVGSDAAVAMLACVSGVSAKAARAVLDVHGSVAGVVDAVRADARALTTIVVNGRKLGKAGEKIAAALLPGLKIACAEARDVEKATEAVPVEGAA